MLNQKALANFYKIMQCFPNRDKKKSLLLLDMHSTLGDIWEKHF